MATPSIAYDKSLAFAKRIVNLYRYLCSEQKEFTLSKQILRSGTSIGANIAEARCGISRKDFISKIYIALKECSETLYWLELLYNCDYLKQTEFESLRQDCEELRRMLSATTCAKP
ncbi:MAG: four helix bundle protein [Oscillospiraceae bacterium]|nr:four helix bundle protein [Oscillospiraceae bacterium]